MEEKLKNSPVTIMGYPNSGTTLLTSLLDFHPQLVVYPEELKYFQFIRDKYFYDNSAHDDLEMGKRAAYYSLRQFQIGSSDKRDKPRDYSDLDFDTYKKILSKKLENANTHKDIFLSVIESFYEIDTSDKKDKRAWVEKTPYNYLYFPLLHKWFDDNLICLHIVRNPYDTLASYRRKSDVSIEQFANNWKLSNSLAIMAKRRIKNYYIIKYEDLASKQESVMRNICSWIGIDFHESLLTPTFNGKLWQGNSSHKKNFKTISSSSIGTRKLLSRKEKEKLDSLLKRSVLRNVIALKFRWRFPELYRWLVRNAYVRRFYNKLVKTV